ncbi:hypothetical protein BSL67_16675, partial [Acinetobacter baylyi]
MPELVSAAQWKKPAWSEILLALEYPLPEREAWMHIWKGLRVGTRLSPCCPGASLGKEQNASPGEEKEPLALLSGNSRKAGEAALG